MRQRPDDIRMPRRSFRTFADYTAAFGLRPLLTGAENKVVGSLGHPIQIGVTVADNTALNLDLRPGNLWDRRVTKLYGSGSVNLKATLKIDAVSLRMGASFATETPALKVAFRDSVYLTIGTGGTDFDLPIGLGVHDSFTHSHDSTADTARYLLPAERPVLLDRPLQIDLETDVFSIKADAIDFTGSGGHTGKLIVYGSIAPKGMIGADGINHANVGEDSFDEDEDGAVTNAGPLQFAALTTGIVNRLRSLVG